jgi:hypothetical protein
MGGVRKGGAAVAVAVLLVVASTASAVGPHGVRYDGRTTQGKPMKLITDRDGVPKRGSVELITDCNGDYRPFSTSIRIEGPFKRATRSGFKVKGHRFDTDGTYSGRYRWKVEGKRKTSRKFKGRIEIEIVFRRKDRKYTTCSADGVGFKVKADKR